MSSVNNVGRPNAAPSTSTAVPTDFTNMSIGALNQLIQGLLLDIDNQKDNVALLQQRLQAASTKLNGAMEKLAAHLANPKFPPADAKDPEFQKKQDAYVEWKTTAESLQADVDAATKDVADVMTDIKTTESKIEENKERIEAAIREIDKLLQKKTGGSGSKAEQEQLQENRDSLVMKRENYKKEVVKLANSAVRVSGEIMSGMLQQSIKISMSTSAIETSANANKEMKDFVGKNIYGRVQNDQTTLFATFNPTSALDEK